MHPQSLWAARAPQGQASWSEREAPVGAAGSHCLAQRLLAKEAGWVGGSATWGEAAPSSRLMS